MTVQGVHIFLLNGAYQEHASRNSLYIPLSVLPVVEINATFE